MSIMGFPDSGIIPESQDEGNDLAAPTPLGNLGTANPPKSPTNIKTVESLLDTALHPERNGMLLKEQVAEGADHEWLVRRELKKAIKQLQLSLLDTVSKRVIGEYDRDYSQDNTDERSKLILVMTSKACNDLRKEQHNTLNAIRKELEEGL